MDELELKIGLRHKECAAKRVGSPSLKRSMEHLYLRSFLAFLYGIPLGTGITMIKCQWIPLLIALILSIYLVNARLELEEEQSLVAFGFLGIGITTGALATDILAPPRRISQDFEV